MFDMALRSLNLPGVGTKYEFETDKGDTVAIFFTKTGAIQMYTLQKGCKTPSAAEMSPVEAQAGEYSHGSDHRSRPGEC